MASFGEGQEDSEMVEWLVGRYMGGGGEMAKIFPDGCQIISSSTLTNGEE